MVTLGIDIGTTSISGVLYAVEEQRPSSVTIPNDTALQSAEPYHRLQDPEAILKRVRAAAEKLLMGTVPDTTVVTGQMHGILYLDAAGKAVSPLYTWEDQSGECIRKESGQTYAAYLSDKTGMRISTGFGICTHFVLRESGKVPKEAVCFCTIADYIALSLCGASKPRMDASMAASFGGFDVRENSFSRELLELTGAGDYLSELSPTGSVLGISKTYGRVLCAVGDNQAGVYGAIGNSAEQVCFNVGTGSQVSAVSDIYDLSSRVEIRPYFGGQYLYVSASLNGGRAYAQLRDFFKACMPDAAGGSVYEWMEKTAEPGTTLQVTPDLFGSRENRTSGGSITGITGGNFTPGHLIAGFIDGMAEELAGMYRCFPEEIHRKATGFTAAGNGLRKNRLLRQRLGKKLGKELTELKQEEEAAYGAALLGAHIAQTEKTEQRVK